MPRAPRPRSVASLGVPKHSQERQRTHVNLGIGAARHVTFKGIGDSIGADSLKFQNLWAALVFWATQLAIPNSNPI